MGKTHRRVEPEVLVFAGFGGEDEPAVRRQSAPRRREDGREVAEINQGVRGDDQVVFALARRAKHRQRIADDEAIVEPQRLRARDHAFGKIDAVEFRDAAGERDGGKAGAAANIKAVSEASAWRDGFERPGDKSRATIGEGAGQMRVEARRILVEEARHIGGRQPARRTPAEQRQTRRGAERVAGVEPQRRAERVARGLGLAEFLTGLAKREPGGGPFRRSLQSLLKHLRRRGPIALAPGGLGIREAALRDGVVRGERIGGHGPEGSSVRRSAPCRMGIARRHASVERRNFEAREWVNSDRRIFPRFSSRAKFRSTQRISRFMRRHLCPPRLRRARAKANLHISPAWPRHRR